MIPLIDGDLMLLWFDNGQVKKAEIVGWDAGAIRCGALWESKPDGMTIPMSAVTPHGEAMIAEEVYFSFWAAHYLYSRKRGRIALGDRWVTLDELEAEIEVECQRIDAEEEARGLKPIDLH